MDRMDKIEGARGMLEGIVQGVCLPSIVVSP